MDKSKKIKIRNLIAYGMGDLYGGGSFFLISTFAMYYLITVVGLSPLLAALVPGLGKVWDAISDPLMGYITDHTRSRFGRRRIYFLIGIIPIVITFILIWLPVSFKSQAVTFFYYFVAYLFFYTVITMVMTPYSALSAEMTLDFKERNRLTGTRMIFSLLATLTGGLVAQPIIDAFPEPSQGHLVMGIVFSILFAVPWVLVFLGTWELPGGENVKSDMNIFRSFKSIFSNRSFLLHIGMYICSYGALDITMGWIKFYMIDYLNIPGYIVIALGAILICEVIGLPFYVSYANRKGHAKAYIIGLAIWAVGMVCIGFHEPFGSGVNPGMNVKSMLLLANCIVIGTGLSAGVVIPWTILPFTTDVDELITTQKRAGIYSGAMTLVRKMIQGALVIPLLGVLLTVIGYREPSRAHVILTQSAGKMIQTANQIARAKDTAAMENASLLLSGSIRRFEQNFAAMTDNVNRENILLSLDKIKGKETGIGINSTPEQRKESAREIAVFTQCMVRDLRIQQSPVAVNWLRYLFILGPLVLIIIGIVFAGRFRITPYTHNVLMEELVRLKKGGKKNDVDPAVKKICETLTGKPYETLYR